MPIYDYSCQKCELDFEIFRSINDHRKKEPCPQCGNDAPQDLSRCRPQFIGTKIEDAEFNHGLGVVTKSKRHRDETAKRLGAVEIGNENPDNIHKHFDKDREERRQKAWGSV